MKISTIYKLKKKIAIIFWEDYLSIAPTIISICNAYAEIGYQVDIFTTNLNPRYPELKFNHENIIIYELYKNTKNPEFGFIVRNINLLFSKLKLPKTFFQLAKNIYKTKQEINSFFIRKKFKSSIEAKINPNIYEACIITDATGFSLLDINKFPTNFLIFLSLEIEYIDSINPLIFPFKYFCTLNLNNNLSKLKNIIIQDNHRKAELITQTNLTEKNIHTYLIPNTYHPAKNLNKTDYLQKEFNISNIIVLHIGQISDVSMSLEIAMSLNNQNDFSLVFHDKKFTNYNDPYLIKIRNSSNSKIFFSLNPVEISELDKIILSSKIGIIAYNLGYGKNFELISNASGKLIMFLRLGIPIVAKEFHGIKEIVDKYNCGIVVNEWHEVIPSLHKIMSNYEYYSKNALTCFLEKFNFNHHFNTFYRQYQINNNHEIL